MRPLSNFSNRDVEALLHPTTNLAAHRTQGPLVLERGEGVHVYDTSGKRYIEGLAGLWCTGLGYGNAELIEAAREQMSRLSFSHLFGGRSHEPAIALAEKIKAHGARARPPRCSSPTRARRPTTRRSSSPGTTTTPAASRSARS